MDKEQTKLPVMWDDWTDLYNAEIEGNWMCWPANSGPD